MSTNFPGSKQTFTNPTSTDYLNSPAHASQHADNNDTVEAIQDKIGTGSSTPTANKVLRGTGAGTSDWGVPDYGDSMPSTNVRCGVGMDGNQSLTAATEATLEFDTESYDSGSDFDTGNYKFVAPVAGYYLITLRVTFAVDSAGDKLRVILKKGGDAIAHAESIPNGTAFVTVQIADVFSLSASDEITATAENRDHDDLVVYRNASGRDATSLAIHLLST